MKYRIREIRKEKGWTIAHLADLVGTTKGYISDLETGKRDGGVQMLRAIAQALGIKEGEIFAPETDEDHEIIAHMQKFMKLDPESRAAIDHLIDSLSSNTS